MSDCRCSLAASPHGKRRAIRFTAGARPQQGLRRSGRARVWHPLDHRPGTEADDRREADIALFDSRSYAEFHDNSIPTAISVPGAELVYRFDDLVQSRDTLVVVNCGGRTRSIIGAQALINAGVPNRVVSLRNGTQDWHLADYEVLRGRTERMPAVSLEGHAAARARAAAIAERFGVPRIDAATLAAWRAEAGARTLYVFDVRDPEEYEAGHIPGMKHVAGGQLVQETDRHAATWGARIVCVDDDGVRAVVTAHWLIQMGWEAAALTLDPSAMTGATGPWQPTWTWASTSPLRASPWTNCANSWSETRRC